MVCRKLRPTLSCPGTYLILPLMLKQYQRMRPSNVVESKSSTVASRLGRAARMSPPIESQVRVGGLFVFSRSRLAENARGIWVAMLPVGKLFTIAAILALMLGFARWPSSTGVYTITIIGITDSGCPKSHTRPHPKILPVYSFCVGSPRVKL